jgi:hypothetical protein
METPSSAASLLARLIATEEMSNLVRNSVQNTQQIMDAANKLSQKSDTLMEVLGLLTKHSA